MSERPTILIPIADGMIARNILRTDTLRVLKERGFRVVVLPPRGKVAYYEKEFGDEQVIIEKEQIWRHTYLEFLLTELFLHSIPTTFMWLRQRDWYLAKKQYVRYALASFVRFLGHFRLWHHVLRAFDALVPTPAYLKAIFDKWQPDLVFAPTMIMRDEIMLMRLARKHGKKTIGMFKSWDNPTSKAFLRFFPDTIICHTEIVREEAWTLYGYPKEQTVVTGVPQYDLYADSLPFTPREAFCKALGIRTESKILLYAPAGDWMTPYDKEVVAGLLDEVDKGTLGDVIVLMRRHPAYSTRAEELEGRQHLVIDRPGLYLQGGSDSMKAVEFDEDAMRHLADSFVHAAVVINSASTLSVEAAILDRPVIGIAYDGDRTLPHLQSVTRFYDREHLVPVVRSGGMPLVRSHAELVRLIQEYLVHPEKDADGRKRIMHDEAVWNDGKSGERVGRVIPDATLAAHTKDA